MNAKRTALTRRYSEADTEVYTALYATRFTFLDEDVYQVFWGLDLGQNDVLFGKECGEVVCIPN